MSNDTPNAAPALNIARLLMEAMPLTANDPSVMATALQQTCTRTFANLRDALGEDGCNALLARSLARTQTQHPALLTVRRLDGDRIHLDGVVAGIESHGVDAVRAAIEALLAALIEVLGRLIGEDMAQRLITNNVPHIVTNGTGNP